jgi:hypothetical protein
MIQSKNQSGQVVIIVALAMLALVGFTALAVDIGYLRRQQSLMQTAADSAAIAGAWALSQGGDWQAAGLYDASLNGFTNGLNGISVALSQPTSGQYAGSQYVQAVVSTNQPTFFMRVFGMDTVALNAVAIAYSGNSRDCVYALDPSAQAALSLASGASLTSACGVIVNSTSNEALQLTSGADVTAPWIGLGSQSPQGPLPANTHYPIVPASDPLAYLMPPTFSNANTNPSTSGCSQPGFTLSGSKQMVITPCTYTSQITVAAGSSLTFDAGNYTLEGGLVVRANGSAVLNPGNYTIQGGIAVSSSSTLSLGQGNYYITGGFAASASSTATFGSGSYFIQGPLSNGGCNLGALAVSSGASVTLGAGTYVLEGGIGVDSGSTLNLGAGTYILEGGGMDVCSGGTLTGNGVTFYNTQNGSSYPYQGINLSSGSIVSLSAPTAGPLAGILFFQDRSVGSSGAPSHMDSGADGMFQGALYFPTTSLDYSSGADAAYTIIVADTIHMTSGSSLNNNYSSLADGSPIKQAILVQ